jgi:hypothetical protein
MLTLKEKLAIAGIGAGFVIQCAGVTKLAINGIVAAKQVNTLLELVKKHNIKPDDIDIEMMRSIGLIK